MKVLNNKSGFTLIELLAVIIVLAIVAVLGYSTVLPLLADSRKNTFATEANGVLDAAQNAMTLVQIDKADKAYVYTKAGTPNGRDYCFSLSDLVSLNMLKKSLKNGKGETIYEGTVTVHVPDGLSAYTYCLSMSNDSYAVSNNCTGNIDQNIVEEKAQAIVSSSCTSLNFTKGY